MNEGFPGSPLSKLTTKWWDIRFLFLIIASQDAQAMSSSILSS